MSFFRAVKGEPSGSPLSLHFHAAETQIFNERGWCFCGGGFAIITVYPYAYIVYG